MLKALRTIANDPKAPATARASAARDLLAELAKLEGNAPAAPVTEMTADELDAEIKRLSS